MTFKELRRRKGYTQDQLAVVSRVGIATVKRLEGHPGQLATATVGTLSKLAAALSTTVAELIEIGAGS